MNKYSFTRGETLVYGFWLIFEGDGAVRLTRAQPGVTRSERAMKCEVTLPLALFKTPELRATITVAEPESSTFAIDVEAVGEALRTALGVDIDLRIAPAEAQ